MRRVVRAASPELLWSSDGSPVSAESSYRELEDVYLQTQTRIWLGEVLHIRFDEETAIANLLADGELLFQVSKVIWKMLLKKDAEIKHSKIHIYEKTSSGKSDGRYMPYPKVDSFLKICKIMGLTGIDLFSPSDVVEKKDVRRVCMCIRTLSKKSRLKNLDVPDFDLVTYTIAMPTDLVGGIRKTLEQSQCSSSGSNSYSPCMDSREFYRQRSTRGDYARYYDSFSESDEAESTFVEPEFESLLSEYEPYLLHTVTERPSDENLVFDEHSMIFEEFMKAFLVPSNSSHEANIHTGDNHSVTSECSVTIEDITNKGCAYTTEVPTANFDSSNMTSSNMVTNNHPLEAYTFNTEGGETNLNSSIFKVQSSVNELVASNTEEAPNTNLYYDRTEEDIALHISEKNSSSADTDATDWSSASETESNFLHELSLLQSMLDPQEMHSCGGSDIFESLGSSSSTTSEKQIIPEVLDDLQIYGGNDKCVPQVDLDIIDSRFATDMPHDKSECPMRDVPMIELDANELPNESIMMAEDGDVRDVLMAPLKVDTNELLNESIMMAEDGDVRYVPTTALEVGAEESIMVAKDGDVRDVPTATLEVDMNELPNESITMAKGSIMVAKEGDVRDVPTIALEVDMNELPNESITMTEEFIMVAKDGDVRDVPTLALEVDMIERPNESIMVVEDGDVRDIPTTVLEVETKGSSMVTEDGDVSPPDLASNYLPVRESYTYDNSQGSKQSDASTLSEPNLQENVSGDMFSNKDAFSASDDTEMQIRNDGLEREASTNNLNESHQSETGAMNIAIDQNTLYIRETLDGTRSMVTHNDLDASIVGHSNDPICIRGSILAGSRSMVTHNELDASNVGHSSDPISVNDPVDHVHSSDATHFKDILVRETIIEVKNPVQTCVDDVSLASLKYEEGDDTIQVEKGTRAEEFEKGDASEPPKSGKKVLKSIAGGVTLIGALFFILHIKGKRDKERNNRAVVPPQARNVRRETVETNKNDKLYPADRLKF